MTTETPEVEALNRVKEAMRAARRVEAEADVTYDLLEDARPGIEYIEDRIKRDLAYKLANALSESTDMTQQEDRKNFRRRYRMGFYVLTVKQFEELVAAVADFTFPKRGATP